MRSSTVCWNFFFIPLNDLLVETNFIDLHPLALEDVLHKSSHSRSKADYYRRHLFINVLCHHLINHNASAADSVDESLDVDEVERLDGLRDDVQKTSSRGGLKNRKRSILPTHSLKVSNTWHSELSSLLKKEKAVNIDIILFHVIVSHSCLQAQERRQNYKKKELSLQAVKSVCSSLFIVLVE